MPPAIANAGRYNVAILEGGTGMERDLTGAEAAVRSNAPWTLSAWARPSEAGADGLLLAIGKPLAGNGDTKTFMTALDTMFGPGASFADF